MPATSLLTLCLREAKRNVKSFTDVGDLEYSQISSVLKFIHSPDQLHELEQNCPQLCGEDAELWQAFIARDVPDWKKKNYAPKNPRNWHAIYKKYVKEQKEDVAKAAETLRQAMQGKRDVRDANTVKIVKDTRYLPKLPKDSRMIGRDGVISQGKRGTGSSPYVASTMRFTEGSRTKTNNASSVLLKARREAKEIHRMNRLLTPMGRIGNKSSGVQRAPQGMVEEHQRAQMQPLKIFAPKKLSAVTNQHGSVSRPTLEERERRLRALKTGNQGQFETGLARQTLVGSDDEHDDGDGSDVFDDTPKPVRTAPVRKLFNRPRPAPQIRREAMPTPSARKQTSTAPSSASAYDLTQSLQTQRRAVTSPCSTSPIASRPSQAGPSISTGGRAPSPGAPAAKRPPPGGMAGAGLQLRRKREVDVFNRGGNSALKKARTSR